MHEMDTVGAGDPLRRPFPEITILAFSLLAASVSFVGCKERRTPVRYLVPSTYEGVLVTLFDQPGFPPLANEDGFVICDFPDDGIIITSSKQEYGWAADELLDVLPDGSRRRIPSKGDGGRRERFSATGSTSGYGRATVVYRFTAIGSDAYWQGKDAKEHDRKIEEAFQKLEREQKKRSGEDKAANRNTSRLTHTNHSRFLTYSSSTINGSRTITRTTTRTIPALRKATI